MYDSSAAWWTGVSRLLVVRIVRNMLAYPFVLFIALTVDVINIGRTTFRSLVDFAHWVRSRPPGAHLSPHQVFGDQATKLDFPRSFWMLQVSSDKGTKVITLNLPADHSLDFFIARRLYFFKFEPVGTREQSKGMRWLVKGPRCLTIVIGLKCSSRSVFKRQHWVDMRQCWTPTHWPPGEIKIQT